MCRYGEFLKLDPEEMDRKIHTAQTTLSALLSGQYPLLDSPYDVAKAILKAVCTTVTFGHRISYENDGGFVFVTC